MPAADNLKIVTFEPRHTAAFRDLNLAWIEACFKVEAPDREQLGDPQRYILDRGGTILVAEEAGAVAGVCALIYISPGTYELAKMAVRLECRGAGIGRKLLAATIAHAREVLEANTLLLLSNRKLASALHLYRDLGFVEVPVEGQQEYDRADVAMEMAL